MELFFKAAAGVLIAAILGLALGNREKDFSILLTIAVCCMVASAAVSFLKPVLDLLWELNRIGEMQDGMLGILLKSVGIALVSELSGMICTDAGNSSLGKTLRMLGSVVILYLSIPVVQALLSLIREILGEL